jgi:DNA-binding MarR family transcriptional regulator
MRQPASREAVYSAIATLQRLADGMDRRRQQLARRVGLSVRQWQVLEEIARPGFMPSLFARRRDSSPAGVSRVLRQLLDRGLVASSIASADARRREYRLTESGERRIAEVRAAREQAMEAVWDGLERQDVEHFARFGALLADRLATYADEQAARDPGSRARDSAHE